MTDLFGYQIKANIGHSEAASGIFAVMKAALMTEAAVIPGVAGFKKLNPASKRLELLYLLLNA